MRNVYDLSEAERSRTQPMARKKIGNCRREAPVLIDLFCGAGGLTLGAARAGFLVAAAVDNDSRTKKAFVTNFPGCKHIEIDIAELSSSQLRDKADLDGNPVHGIVGGPPCQGFSMIGHRNRRDPRNSLFCHFFRLVAEIRPRFYLAENVLGILDRRFEDIRRNALAMLEGYTQLAPLTLKASDFGAATSRERVFFIGFLDEHPGAIKETDFDPPHDSEKVTVEIALRGLRQKISADWQSDEKGRRALTCRPDGVFWRKIFDEVPEGIGDLNSLQRLRKENLVSGCIGTRHTKAVFKRFAALAEGAVDPPSRAIRLRRKGSCPTLRSGTGPDRGSFQALRPIHPTEPRVITPREAARLQGFPDWFVFDHTKWHSFRQIGNSVSPILAEAILRKIREKLRL